MAENNGKKLARFITNTIIDTAAGSSLSTKELTQAVQDTLYAWWTIHDGEELKRHLRELAEKKGHDAMREAVKILHRTLDKAEEMQEGGQDIMGEADVMSEIRGTLTTFLLHLMTEGEKLN